MSQKKVAHKQRKTAPSKHSGKPKLDPEHDLFPEDVVEEFGGERSLLSSLESLSEKLHDSESKKPTSETEVPPPTNHPRPSKRIQ